MKNWFVLIGFLLVLGSCNYYDVHKSLGVFEKTAFFPDHTWESSHMPVFTFRVSDTSARYNFFVVIRHTAAYPYNNIWLNLTTTDPGDTALSQKLNLKLGDNTKGWLGTGMDDVYDHRILINRYPEKLKPGIYTFRLQQIMRQDPLPEILNAGIRIEKIS